MVRFISPLNLGEKVVHPEPDFGCGDLASKWDDDLKAAIRRDIVNMHLKYSLAEMMQINPLGVRIKGRRVRVPIRWWPRYEETKKWLTSNS